MSSCFSSRTVCRHCRGLSAEAPQRSLANRTVGSSPGRAAWVCREKLGANSTVGTSECHGCWAAFHSSRDSENSGVLLSLPPQSEPCFQSIPQGRSPGSAPGQEPQGAVWESLRPVGGAPSGCRLWLSEPLEQGNVCEAGQGPKRWAQTCPPRFLWGSGSSEGPGVPLGALCLLVLLPPPVFSSSTTSQKDPS